MKRQAFAAIALVALLACTNGKSNSEEVSDPVAKFSWLSGCWVSEDGSVREVWSESFNGLLFGYSVTRTDGQITFFEDIRIEPREKGSLYIASPLGTGTTEFILTHADEQSATFENPAHDFPQHLRYHRKNNRLTAKVSSLDGNDGFQVKMHTCD